MEECGAFVDVPSFAPKLPCRATNPVRKGLKG